MSDFKVGERVEYVGDMGIVPYNSAGTVLRIRRGTASSVEVRFDKHPDGSHYCYPPSLRRLVTPDPKPVAVAESGGGMKFDAGKSRWSLLMGGCSKALAGVAAVLTFGAAKYAAHSWKQVENNKERYRDAMYRHLNAIESGEELDPESGLPHWDHVACNALFLSELNKESK